MNRDLAARLVVGLIGTWPTAFESSWLTQWQPGGVILFSRNINDYSALCDLCKVLRQLVPDLEIMADHEGGPVSHLAAAVGRPPSAWSLGALDDVGLTARVFAQTGNRLRQAGVDRVLGPVADVMTEPRNPVIGVRSFGPDPSLVSRHTVAAVTGLLEGGVTVCLKHWPGHGGSDCDSHLGETSVLTGALPAPFESGLTAGAGAVMVGHLLVGGEDHPGSGLPATLDSDFMSRTRQRLGPGNVADLLFFADDITMGALGPAMKRLGVSVPSAQDSGLFDPGSLPPEWFDRLVSAGCDRLLIRGIPSAAFPLTGNPVGPEPWAGPESAGNAQFSPGPYAEVRRRMWAMAGSDFPDSGADLLWLDFSRHDRWEVAAGLTGGKEGGGTQERIMARLSRVFRSVCTNADNLQGGIRWNRLLVSSHRPLSHLEDLAPYLDSRGVCLALGHPSLKTDLEELLGAGWKIGALYDIAPEDLIYSPREAEH
jgi:hypothetical protein